MPPADIEVAAPPIQALRPRTRAVCHAQVRGDRPSTHTRHRRRSRAVAPPTSPRAQRSESASMPVSSASNSSRSTQRQTRRRQGHGPGSPRIDDEPSSDPSPSALANNVLTRSMVDEWRGILQRHILATEGAESPVRGRPLFGRPTADEMKAFWTENHLRFAQQFRSDWNFDPESGVPLPGGDYEWQPLEENSDQ